MKQTTKKRYALFMIFLVVSLIINTSLVLASLTNITAVGSDGIENIIREEDTITFTATVDLDYDSDISPSQILLGTSKTFDTCEVKNDQHVCTLRFPSEGTTRFDQAAVPFTIRLHSDTGRTVAERTGSLYVDSRVPVINSFDVDVSQIGSGTIRFPYTITDSSCSGSNCNNKCSGVEKIELFTFNNTFAQTFIIDSDTCTTSGTLDVLKTKLTNGEHTIFIRATDKLGLKSSEDSVTFALDKDAPFIDQNTFKITDEIDFDIEYFNAKRKEVTVSVQIRDNNLDLSSVVADLREIGGSEGVRPICTEPEDQIYTCTWQTPLFPQGEGLKRVPITASDFSGNKVETVLAKNMAEDNEGPVLLSFRSDNQLGDKDFAHRTQNKFIALFSDNVGVAPSNAIVKASGKKYSATTCFKESANWQCEWENVVFSNSGENLIFVEDTTTDRLGNEMEKTFSKKVIIDAEQPKLINVSVTPITSDGTDIAKTGGSVAIVIYVEDDFISSAKADLSKFITGATDVQADNCVQQEESVFACFWTTAPIDIPGYIEKTILIEVTDAAGNTLSTTAPLKVLGTEEGSADFWDYSITCSPQLLDRELFELINQRAFCHIQLYPNSGYSGSLSLSNIQPASITLGQCTGDTGFIKEINIYNNDVGSFDPYIGITFNKQQARVDLVTLECPVNIITKSEDTILITPEVEFIQTEFRFYNMPLGEISDSVQGKIDAAIDDALGFLSFLSTLKLIVFYATKACDLIHQFQQVVNALSQITSLFGKFDYASLGLTSGARLSSCISTEAAAKNSNQMLKDLNKYCNFVNCRHAPGPQADVKKSEGETTWLGWIGNSFTSWQDAGTGFVNKLDPTGLIHKYGGNPPVSYMNPKDSLVLATLTACIPGIINGIDKYRQIQCMYADCLITAVGENGLPVYVCEDQKAYATCKYVVGEIFAIIPYVAVFDFFANKIKDTLSDPFKILGAAIGASCEFLCPEPGGTAWQFCRFAKIGSTLSYTIQSVTTILDGSYFEPPKDYCENLQEYKDKKEGKTED